MRCEIIFVRRSAHPLKELSESCKHMRALHSMLCDEDKQCATNIIQRHIMLHFDLFEVNYVMQRSCLCRLMVAHRTQLASNRPN